MRIVSDCRELAPVNGAILDAFEITRQLAHRGHSIDILYERGGELEPEVRSYSHSLRQVPFLQPDWGRKVRSFAAMVPAIVAGARTQPDIVYAQTSWVLEWALATGRLAGAPVVCHVHGTRPLLGSRRLLPRVQRFIAVSSFLADQWIRAGVDPDQVRVVPNGVDPWRFTPAVGEERAAARLALGVPDSTFVVLYLGRFDPEKGVEVLLDAWGRLTLTPDEGCLVLQGQVSPSPNSAGEMDRLRGLASASCVWVSMRRDVITALHAADVVAVPSVWEDPAPLVVIEAMACGVPVVASRVGGIPELFAGLTGDYLFDPGDAGGLAQRLEALATWRRDTPGLGTVLSAHARERFTVTKMVDAVEQLLIDVLGT
jgi:glycosyltransferase involved in cell wall biosynthesis